MVVDAHTGAFIDDMWQKAMFLQRFFCKKAEFTIVTNQALADIVHQWGGKSVIIPDVPIQFPEPTMPDLKGEINITLVNSFAVDEPLAEFLEAAKQFPDIHFYITGKLNSKADPFLNINETNIHFTDFIPDAEYHGLLLNSDLIVVLTTRDHTMQRGAYEAIYLGRPVITSDWPLLRENFPKGAIFVDNSVDGIAQGLTKAINMLSILKADAERTKSWKLENWEHRKSNMMSNLK
jgi:glycosyltransferase involved in cell wall biosynthesis